MTYKMREKYKEFIEKEGGIFTPAKRRRLLKYSSGRESHSQKTAQFRYDTRRFVSQALVDLALFIDVADDKDIDKVINVKSLEPIFQTLFWNVNAKPNKNLAKIANLLIWYSYHYLKTQNPIRLPSVLDNQIDSAIEICDYLTECFISSNLERPAGNPPLIARIEFPDVEGN